MPVRATQLVRRMRGGAQAQLLKAEDGRHYVTKFRDNPQHRRVLINEWLGSVFLRHIGVSVPPFEIVDVPADLIAREPEMSIQWGSRREPVGAGWHFGSQYPGHPDTLAVYDYLPDSLLKEVVNREQFLGALAFDKWAGNADSRQAVFFRAQLRDWVEAAPGKKGFVGLMIDHGFLFDGPGWDYLDSPVQGLYHRKLVYETVTGWRDFEPWVERIRAFPEGVVDEAWRQIPPAWVDDDGPALERLLEKLLSRRRRVAGLLEASARSHLKPFPNWVR